MMNKVYLWFWRLAFNVIFKRFYHVHIYGLENVPETGAVIVAPNHVSNFDPPLIGCALPRHINFMAKEELFHNFFMRHLITWLGAFPVRRNAVDKIAIRKAMDILKNGLVLGIFPEGRRNPYHEMGEFHDGVASLALRMGVPVIPTAIIGSEEMIRGKIAITFAPPVVVEKQKATSGNIAVVNAKIREAIETMKTAYENGEYTNGN